MGSKLTFIPVEGNFKYYFCLKLPFREEFVEEFLIFITKTHIASGDVETDYLFGNMFMD